MFDKPPVRPLGHTSEPSRSYQSGELICREGEHQAEMFVIRRGSVRIFKASPHGELELAVLHKGDFFGEMSVLENLPRDASAQAVGDTEVLVMTPGALLVRLRRDPTLAFELLRRLSGRVRSLNARLLAALHAGDASTSTAIPAAEVSLLYRAETNEAGTVPAGSLPADAATAPTRKGSNGGS